jgi:hypothetical protein
MSMVAAITATPLSNAGLSTAGSTLDQLDKDQLGRLHRACEIVMISTRDRINRRIVVFDRLPVLARRQRLKRWNGFWS